MVVPKVSGGILQALDFTTDLDSLVEMARKENPAIQ